jgi:hypothetical protein
LGYRKTVAETPLFIKQAAELFTEDERKELIDFLAANPLVRDAIPGTGGVRKVRFGAKGRGQTWRRAGDLLLVQPRGPDFRPFGAAARFWRR